jgi:hypothetical protein
MKSTLISSIGRLCLFLSPMAAGTGVSQEAEPEAVAAVGAAVVAPAELPAPETSLQVNSLLRTETHRYFSLNPESSLTKEGFGELIEPLVAAGIAGLDDIPKDAQWQGQFVDTIYGSPHGSRIAGEALTTLAERGALPAAEVRRCLEDIEEQESLFRRFRSLLGVYILEQYIPLTPFQEDSIFRDGIFDGLAVGRLLDASRTFRYDPAENVLAPLLSDRLSALLDEDQKKLLQRWRTEWSDKSQSLHSINLSRDSSGDSRPEALVPEPASGYFSILFSQWQQKYGLSTGDIRKLDLAVRVSFRQLVESMNPPGDGNNPNRLPQQEVQRISNSSAVHLIRSWHTMTKMVEKLSTEPESNEQPIDDFKRYGRHCGEMNAHFILFVLGVFGPEMAGAGGGRNTNPGLTGAQMESIFEVLKPSWTAQSLECSFPDLRLLVDMVLRRQDQYREFLVEEQLDILDAMAGDLNGEVDRPE